MGQLVPGQQQNPYCRFKKRKKKRGIALWTQEKTTEKKMKKKKKGLKEIKREWERRK